MEGGGADLHLGGPRRRHRNEGCTIKSQKRGGGGHGVNGGMVTTLLLFCYPPELKPYGKHCLLEIIINFCSAYISLYARDIRFTITEFTIQPRSSGSI